MPSYQQSKFPEHTNDINMVQSTQPKTVGNLVVKGRRMSKKNTSTNATKTQQT